MEDGTLLLWSDFTGSQSAAETMTYLLPDRIVSSEVIGDLSNMYSQYNFFLLFQDDNNDTLH